MNPDLSSNEVEDYLRGHIDLDSKHIALLKSPFESVSSSELATQHMGLQFARKSVPAWYAKRGLIYPKSRALQQASSEATGLYKAQLAGTIETFWDLSGGLGIDTYLLGSRSTESHYVEPQDELCTLAQHNFPLLGLEKVHIYQGEAREFLRTHHGKADLAFVDPDRRDSSGRKKILWRDCRPDMEACIPALEGRVHRLLVKASPLLDLSRGAEELNAYSPTLRVSEIHVVAHKSEVKELLFLMEYRNVPTEKARIVSTELDPDRHFRFEHTLSEEAESMASNADPRPGNFLYDPHPALRKSGAFKTLSTRFGLGKLHTQTHLYTSEAQVEFPGKTYRIKDVFSAKASSMKAWKNRSARIICRNYPAEPQALRKKYRIGEGEESHLFFCRSAGNETRVIESEEIL